MNAGGELNASLEWICAIELGTWRLTRLKLRVSLPFFSHLRTLKRITLVRSYISLVRFTSRRVGWTRFDLIQSGSCKKRGVSDICPDGKYPENVGWSHSAAHSS